MDFLSTDTIEMLAQTYGYWTIAVGILMENAGIPIPGETITLIGGFLAGSGELNYWYVLGSATIGAIVGDNIGYWIGVYGGWPLLLRLSRVFHIPESRLIRVRDEFRQRAPQAVIVGRFVAILRVFAGPMAGIAQMPYLTFLGCNALGAVLWATTMTSLAFFVGRFVPLEVLLTSVSRVALVILGLVILWLAKVIWKETRIQQAE